MLLQPADVGRQPAVLVGVSQMAGTPAARNTASSSAGSIVPPAMLAFLDLERGPFSTVTDGGCCFSVQRRRSRGELGSDGLELGAVWLELWTRVMVQDRKGLVGGGAPIVCTSGWDVPMT